MAPVAPQKCHLSREGSWDRPVKPKESQEPVVAMPAHYSDLPLRQTLSLQEVQLADSFLNGFRISFWDKSTLFPGSALQWLNIAGILGPGYFCPTWDLANNFYTRACCWIGRASVRSALESSCSLLAPPPPHPHFLPSFLSKVPYLLFEGCPVPVQSYFLPILILIGIALQ